MCVGSMFNGEWVLISDGITGMTDESLTELEQSGLILCQTAQW